ncbi:MAG: hypothetical protein ONB25_13545 [candidate division KSB1 bacterium]|nr:hypothetical protein [candidate division KSB1 bacterium]MDZ7413358.1 hypothetical protein [candidate division KSB1 bacterium]
MKPNFGTDFGGVIVKNRKWFVGENPDFNDPNDSAAAREGVVEAISEIVSLCEGRVWIVSKGGPRRQAATFAWLHDFQFFSRTGLDPEHVVFCRERQEKEGICRQLEITHFVDDRIHVMQILRYAVPHLYLFVNPGNERFCPPWATPVFSWSEVVQLFKASLEQGRSTPK